MRKRVDVYNGELDSWFEQNFAPLLDVIELRALGWEDAIGWIRADKPGVAAQLSEFYEHSLKFK